MTLSSKWAVLSAAVVLAADVSTAAAANGVQKLGPHTSHGWVVGVQHGNGQGTFRITTGHWNNNLVGVANQLGMGGAQAAVRTFAVGPATQFVAVQGGNPIPVSFASLRHGQRVIVLSQGQQALGVRILAGNPYAGTMGRAHYGGSRHALRVPGVNQGIPSIAAVPQTTHVRQPKPNSSHHGARGVPTTHAVSHAVSKKS